MDTVHDNRDLEAEKPMVMSEPSRTTPAFIEAAALLTLWSLVIINEGAVRLNNTAPSVELFVAGRPSKAILFFAALGEVIFGILGLFVGIAAFMFQYYNTMLTKATMVVQTALGYFVFVVYVFVRPIFMVVDIEGPLVDGMSISQSRGVLAMGLLVAFHFCLALQGGQFIFLARLVVAGTGQDFLMQKTGARMRAIFWNANLAFSGFWTLVAGAIISANATEDGKLSMPFVAPPNVGRLPGLTIWTGLLLLLWGTGGVFAAMRNKPVSARYFLVTGYVYLSAFLNFGIVQFGLIAGPKGEPSPSGDLSIHNGLVFMVVFIAMYFVRVMSKEAEQAHSE